MPGRRSRSRWSSRRATWSRTVAAASGPEAAGRRCSWSQNGTCSSSTARSPLASRYWASAKSGHTTTSPCEESLYRSA
ncbi:Uncharacterised protein [Mycobacteroides abscessus]|nr:Uncharacterised protein [Mycobacteroides abscessus]